MNVKNQIKSVGIFALLIGLINPLNALAADSSLQISQANTTYNAASRLLTVQFTAKNTSSTALSGLTLDANLQSNLAVPAIAAAIHGKNIPKTILQTETYSHYQYPAKISLSPNTAENFSFSMPVPTTISTSAYSLQLVMLDSKEGFITSQSVAIPGSLSGTGSISIYDQAIGTSYGTLQQTNQPSIGIFSDSTQAVKVYYYIQNTTDQAVLVTPHVAIFTQAQSQSGAPISTLTLPAVRVGALASIQTSAQLPAAALANGSYQIVISPIANTSLSTEVNSSAFLLIIGTYPVVHSSLIYYLIGAGILVLLLLAGWFIIYRKRRVQ